MGQDTGSPNTTGSEKEIGMTTENANPRHLARPVQRLYTTTRRQAQKGLNAENSRPATARGGDISLDIPFYRTGGWARLFGSPKTRRRRASQGCRFREKRDAQKALLALNNASAFLLTRCSSCAEGAERPTFSSIQAWFPGATRIPPRYSRVIRSVIFALFRVNAASRMRYLRALAMLPAKSVHDRCRFNAA